jgi:PRTRC genetic system protein C
MSLKITELKRVFKYKNETLKDPNSLLTPMEVLDFYSDHHPELVNAKIESPITNDDQIEFTFSVNFKEKG